MPLYFAYGSNVNAAQMRRRCPSSAVVAIARLRGWRLTFAGWSKRWQGGVATLERKKGSEVVGVLYRVSETDLEKLDRYEGAPFFYRRRRVRVQVDGSGEVVEAITYVLRGHERALPAAEYVRTIAEGYRFFGLGLKPLIEPIETLMREAS